MDDRTQQLDLSAPIPTGNIKAAAATAGATKADLWMVPYEQLHCDPSDNIRPVDPEWVTHLTALMMENGYDKGSPLHCYARKVAGKDLLYVYKGQHRYLAAGKAIEAGKDIGKIPVVVRDAKTANRAEMVIDGYLSNNGKPSSPLDLAAAVAELRDIHGMTLAAICKRLNVTDQTVRDVGLLERAPAELHQLVREGQCTGTLAIEQIRLHGGDKALERIVVGIAKAAEAGKTKVTKKYLDAAPLLDALPATASSEEPPATAAATSAKPVASLKGAEVTVKTQAPAQSSPRQSASATISNTRALWLLQALHSVLHDPAFDQLSPGTMHAVRMGLHGVADSLLDAVESTRTDHPVHVPNKHGVFDACETIKSPASKRTGKNPAAIHLAHAGQGVWISSFTLQVGSGGMSGLPSLHSFTETYPTRGQAIRGAVSDMTRVMQSSSYAKSKEAPIVHAWLDKLYAMPDPEWTPELAAKYAVTQEAS
ncbi:ParB/RepB/Spo0J family partition protein [Burkholderia vietnamiensis]|uniref:ParB/RepB/Spo0J family partition protein n=1 Tax=Burkholderia vietnamiensis TaxID=60552 RepID=UPI00159460ED|nr:pyridoxal phosphate biosynthetic protein PdxJ [Burkholderia vietnamiensis]MCA7945182.1 pyridoxal phosphate biosynthetic protein PdxJ [Burkholderia vietnamiensis]HDR8969949.1 pyridoxal phosphate biosynthetic protein PdxJ [Burkholderia vietnamiensis]HDR9143101.1 pyridoxal phosphate biosynthetic protein PdxJ [Burkholderia vietnamiensis]HDR9219348.1 pyridoxal phosphate biosynthetic protein PdxJ [Burkholderia vietnamiensis]